MQYVMQYIKTAGLVLLRYVISALLMTMLLLLAAYATADSHNKTVATINSAATVLKNEVGAAPLPIDIRDVLWKLIDTQTTIQVQIAELQAENKHINDKIVQLRVDTKADIAQLRVDTKADIAQLRVDTKTDIAGLRTDVKQLEDAVMTNQRWSVGIFITILLSLLAPPFARSIRRRRSALANPRASA